MVENTFLHMVFTWLKLPLQKTFLEIFCCQIVTFDVSQAGYSKNNKTWVFQGLMKKTFAFTVENTFSRYADTCLRFILQNIFVKSLRFQVVIFDLPQTDITKNKKIRIFLSLKKKNLADTVENIFLLNPNLGGLFRCSFWGGVGKGKITPPPFPSKFR